MIPINFQNITHESDVTCEAPSVILVPVAVRCGETSHQLAVFRDSMWWVNNAPFTSAVFGLEAVVSFVGGPNLGICYLLRLVNQFLYDGDTLIARTRGDRWIAVADQREYQSIRVTRKT
jgi:hypothetical protein